METKETKILESLKQQILDEVGGEEEYEDTPNRVRFMLNQKYGIIPPQLTNSERHLITKEVR